MIFTFLLFYYPISRLIFIVYYRIAGKKKVRNKGAWINAMAFILVPPLGDIYFVYRVYDAWRFEYGGGR